MRPHRNPNRWPCEAHLDHLGCCLSSASEQCSQTREMTTACPNCWSPVKDHHMLFHSDPFKFPDCLLELSASLDALLESRNNQKQTRNDRQQNVLQDMLWAYKPASLTAWKNTIFKVSYSVFAYLSFQATWIKQRKTSATIFYFSSFSILPNHKPGPFFPVHKLYFVCSIIHRLPEMYCGFHDFIYLNKAVVKFFTAKAQTEWKSFLLCHTFNAA